MRGVRERVSSDMHYRIEMLIGYTWIHNVETKIEERERKGERERSVER